MKISLSDFLGKLFTHFKGQWRVALIKIYMPSYYNIQNTDKRYLFSLFLEYNKNVRKIDILQDSANKG